MLREKEGILEDRQVLSFDGRRLEHDYRIMDNDIPNKSIIQLSEKSRRLKLYFRMPSNENNFELEADNSEEFCGIKSVMQSKLGIPKHKYTIYYAGKVVENHQTVASLNIQGAEAILQMKLVESMTNYPSEDWDLFSGGTRLQNAKTLAYYEIKEHDMQFDTIRAVKENIFQQTDVPINHQGLMFGGQKLEDDKDLAHYSIEEGCTLHELTR
ncbi:hypothetical protein EZV62_008045 [Acer yangbiense]|uniref:Ubiquitin-like domain-containing protein n=1 Tax=Acer yangbiense TaxID=1000413 RepID=A0A5C7IBN4_9ROSI|nr:hypothetical protein EZV62_008045 [Acer yangbiense]